MRARCRFFLTPAMVAIFVFCLAAMQAQSTIPASPNPAQNPVPVYKSNTRAVAVDVVVTRGQDEPVTSLHRQDFQVIEDGKPQQIDFFEEHTVPVASAPIPPLPALPPHVYTNVPAAPQSDSVNVLLLDSLNTPRQDQSQVRRQILEFLKTMKPQARIAIFMLGSRLRLIQGFSDDPAVLRAAVEDKKSGFDPMTTEVSRGRTEDDEDKREVEVRQQNRVASVASLQASQVEFVEMESDNRVAMTLEALRNLGRYLAGIPGRKNLIWFASQYPVDFFPKSLEKEPFNDRREHTEAIKETADLLMLSKVALYPIDAEGMMNDHPMDSDHDLAAAGLGGGLLRNTMNGANDRAAKMSAMEQLAAETGGEAIFNNNDLNSALGRAIHNGAHYYTIVYTPTDKKMDGQFRRIQVKLYQVKLDQGKYNLSYRRGYYADDSTAAAQTNPDASTNSSSATKQDVSIKTDHLRSLMVRGMPSSTQILYGVRVIPASPQPAPDAKRAGLNAKLSGPTTRYAIDFLIDSKQVQFEATPEGNHTGKIRVELLAYDRDGKALNWNGATMHSAMDSATYADVQKSGVPVHMEIDVPNTQVYLATGIYDLEANTAGTLEIPIDAGGKSATVAMKIARGSK